ncbi:MAG: hypothetical protein IT376_08820 [Polyangiaceae bacterium]|nr:hypothetical protein [Polyangiaceae bacterium]
MDAARPRPVRSFGRLAELALGHEGWPAGSPIRPRSLAALLSKLDRGVDLEWLRDRRDVQRVLVAALGCDASEVDDALRSPGGPPAPSSPAVRWRDLRWAQSLDLRSEELPPGLPSAITRREWSRALWVAPPGSGRGLVGAWLQARGLATRASVTTLAAAAALAESRAGVPWFFEVEHDDRGDGDSLARLAASASAWCAALARPPVASLPAELAVHYSPSPDSYIEPLAEWVAGRIARDGHFQPAEAAAWVRAQALPRRWATDFGSALGWLGVCDELGVDALGRAGARRIVERWLTLRASEALDARDSLGWLARDGWELLLALAQARLRGDTGGLEAPLPRAGWFDSIPDEIARAPDLEWLVAAVPEPERAARARELERARRRLPPGAFRAVRALERAGVLEPASAGAAHAPGAAARRPPHAHGEEQLRLGPRWLVCVLREAAFDAIARAPALVWGEALLGPHAEDVTRALSARVVADETSPLDDEAELDAGGDPAAAAAVEAAARVAGLALLSGVPLAEPDAAELFADAVDCALELGGRLVPRIAHAQGAGAALSPGAWRLALLALSERSRVPARRRSASLAPWRADAPTGLALAELDEIRDTLTTARAERAPWAHGATLLVDRHRSLTGAAVTPRGPHALHAPGAWLDEIALGVPAWSTLAALEPSGVELEALAELAARRSLAFTDVAEAMWRAWDAAGCPASELFAPGAPSARVLWPHVPVEVLPRAMRAHPAWWARVPVGALDAARWAALLEVLGDAEPETSAALARQAPEAPLASALAGWIARDRPELAAAAWARVPADVADQLVAALSRGDERTALALLGRAPAEATAQVARAVAAASAGAALPGAVTAWLYDRVRDRAPGWREAFALLGPRS